MESCIFTQEVLRSGSRNTYENPRVKQRKVDHRTTITHSWNMPLAWTITGDLGSNRKLNPFRQEEDGHWKMDIRRPV